MVQIKIYSWPNIIDGYDYDQMIARYQKIILDGWKEHSIILHNSIIKYIEVDNADQATIFNFKYN